MLKTRVINKAKKSFCKFKVSAVALDGKGDVISYSTNKPRFSKHHGGFHAERLLMSKYGSRIKTIIICRVGNGGDLLPIDPCEACQKMADKLGIKILSIKE